jgi:hypothetical protein
MSNIDAGMTLPPTERQGGESVPKSQRRRQTAQVWVMCRKLAGSGAVENVRAYSDEARAQADLELAESVSSDEFWLAAVPFLEVSPAGTEEALSSVQRLALTWLAQGAEAEASMPGDDPVVISPRHVRGFVSVPPEEWRRMEEHGWVRNGMITAEGMAVIDPRRTAKT